MSDLTDTEQANVRAALSFFRVRFGKVSLLAEALKFRTDSVNKVLSGHDNVSASMVLRLARLTQVGVDDLLNGKYPIPGTCPHCGHVAATTSQA